ncbi:telomerase reverse transcriptase [Colletotrichum chrysophilum]|uniref:Telomerase reverse transcriptase n=1 Tax=Colletotrichum chrysophilum TaxID=1836956 RepID=A0AAD9A195_9PEZI|nr:telomerase reverse transcriptase [Colletotrichum chrysophilum]
MQTHHANQQMKSIAELTADDSAAMKQLSFIALILLPVTVVSTVLSTDIVKFQDLPNENESASAAGEGPPDAPVPVYSFSVAAFGTWAVASLVMTVVTLAIVKPLGGRRGANRRTRLRLPRLSMPWNLGGVAHTGEGQTTTPPEPSPVARSIHTAPAVGKTASQCPETPVGGLGDPVAVADEQDKRDDVDDCGGGDWFTPLNRKRQKEAPLSERLMVVGRETG